MKLKQKERFNIKKKLEHKIKLKINEINVLLSKNNISCKLKLKDFTIDNKCMYYEFLYIKDNYLYSIDNVKNFKKFLLNFSAIEILSNIQTFFAEYKILSLIEDVFKKIDLNQKLNEEIIVDNEIRIKKKI